ncbi:hypothetical protein TNCV_2415901 [Trichonephila clavipes]|nr:hypothetical protein TNCV_2415901 [Trichonephila clavipes]
MEQGAIDISGLLFEEEAGQAPRHVAHHLYASEGIVVTAFIAHSELVVGIASMGKLPDVDAFDRGQIVGARRMDY